MKRCCLRTSAETVPDRLLLAAARGGDDQRPTAVLDRLRSDPDHPVR